MGGEKIISPAIYLSVYLSIYLSIYLPIDLSACRSIGIYSSWLQQSNCCSAKVNMATLSR